MASAQTVMVVLDIEYRYVGHGESNGARSMRLVKVVTKEVRDLGTSMILLNTIFALCTYPLSAADNQTLYSW
jgi:hypothetical protein